MKEYSLSDEAAADLEELFGYIAVDNCDAADRVLDPIRDALRRFAERPGIGHRREDLTEHDLRFWPVGSYMIVYMPELKPIGIVAILHGARKVAAILSDRLNGSGVPLGRTPQHGANL